MKECWALLLLLGTAFAYPNVAHRGKATQSTRSDSPYANANNAIDGNIAAKFSKGTCSSTAQQLDPWWRLDLLDTYVITSIKIYNRQDGQPERLNGAEIRVGDSLVDDGKRNPKVGTINTPAGMSQTFTFDDRSVMGRYVMVLLPGSAQILTLCEVEVFGYHAPTGANLAIRGKATQSSISENKFAYFAIDGNREGVYTHTERKYAPWWRLDLGKTHRIFSVNVTNANYYPERLNGAEIRIGNSLEKEGNDNPKCADISSIEGGSTVGFNCNGMNGRYVNIVIPGREGELQLREVEVYGSVLD